MSDKNKTIRLLKQQVIKAKNLFQKRFFNVFDKIQNKVLSFRRFWYITFQTCVNQDIYSLAQALSYITVLSLVPIGAVFFLVLGFLIEQDAIPIVDGSLSDNQSSLDIFQRIIGQFLPDYVQPVMDQLLKLSDKAVSVGLVGFPALILTSMVVYLRVDRSINQLWSSSKRRSLFSNFSVFISSVILGPALLVMSLSVPTYIKVYLNISSDFFESILWGFGNNLVYIFPFLVSWFLFFFLYYLVPTERVHKKSAFIGAFWSSVLVKVTNWIVGIYLAYFSKLDILYGSLLILPVLMIWLYSVWLIVLFCSVLVYAHQTFAHKNFVITDNLLMQDSNLGLAFKILIYLAYCFEKRLPPRDLLEICYSLNSDKSQTHRLITHLSKAQLISNVYVGVFKKSVDTKYQISCASDKIKVAEVLDMYSSKQLLPHLPKHFNEFYYFLDTSPFLDFRSLNLADLIRLSHDNKFPSLHSGNTELVDFYYFISVDKLVLRLKIGINDWEKTALQPVEVSFKLKLVNSAGVSKEEINNTIDYSKLKKEVKAKLENRSYKLLEALLDDLLSLLLQFKTAQSVWAKVSKPYATRSSASISIEGERSK